MSKVLIPDCHFILIYSNILLTAHRLAMAGAACPSSASFISTATQIKYGLRPVCFAEFNRASNAAKLQMDKKGINYKTRDNAFVHVEDPEQLPEIVKDLDGRAVMKRAQYCLPARLA